MNISKLGCQRGFRYKDIDIFLGLVAFILLHYSRSWIEQAIACRGRGKRRNKKIKGVKPRLNKNYNLNSNKSWAESDIKPLCSIHNSNLDNTYYFRLLWLSRLELWIEQSGFISDSAQDLFEFKL